MRVLSNESIISQASDHSSTRDIKSAVFPVTVDRSGHSSLGFLVVVRIVAQSSANAKHHWDRMFRVAAIPK